MRAGGLRCWGYNGGILGYPFSENIGKLEHPESVGDMMLFPGPVIRGTARDAAAAPFALDADEPQSVLVVPPGSADTHRPPDAPWVGPLAGPDGIIHADSIAEGRGQARFPASEGAGSADHGPAWQDGRLRWKRKTCTATDHVAAGVRGCPTRCSLSPPLRCSRPAVATRLPWIPLLRSPPDLWRSRFLRPRLPLRRSETLPTSAPAVTDQTGAEFVATVTWTSENPEVFTVAASGLVTAVGNGTGTVRASFQDLTATAQVTVRQVVAAVAVSPELDTLFTVGATVTLTAEAADANDHPIAQAEVDWKSSVPRIVTVDQNGLVTAVGEGQARIVATADGVGGSALVVAATVTRIAIAALDTTAVVSIDAAGGEWTYEVTESRWLDERPVARVTRVENPAGVEVEVLGPGWVQIDPVVSGERLRSLRLEVVPPRPIVVSLSQEDWPASDVVTARGYAVDRIALPAFLVGGESAVEAFGDSAEMRFRPSPLHGGECLGIPMGEGTVEVINAEVEDASRAGRLAGSLAHLDPGESYRLGGADACLRFPARAGAAYALAGVERSAIDAARLAPSSRSYGGGAPYQIEVTDRTVSPAARRQLPRVSAARESETRKPAPPRLHPPGYSVKGSLDGLDTRTAKWRVGDEFEWYTNDDREGVFQVVALYPPNVVFAVFKEDMESIWTDARAEEFDEIMNWLGSEAVQDLYKTVFGLAAPDHQQQQ